MNQVAIVSNSTIVIKDASGQPVTTSLAIADGTHVQHKNVMESVRTHIESLRQFGEIAFETRNNEQGRDTEIALLNEPQSSLLIAFMRNSAIVIAFKVALVKGFYDMRAELMDRAPKSFASALRLAAEQQEIIEARDAKIALDAPKVAFAEAVRSIDGVCHIEKVAKTLGYGRTKFFKRLRDEAILMRNNLPYQKYLDREYFTVVEQEPYTDSKGVKHPTFTAMVTGAGQVFLARKYSGVAA